MSVFPLRRVLVMAAIINRCVGGLRWPMVFSGQSCLYRLPPAPRQYYKRRPRRSINRGSNQGSSPAIAHRLGSHTVV